MGHRMAAGVVALGLLTGCASPAAPGDSSPSDAQTPSPSTSATSPAANDAATPEDAIAAWLERNGLSYAGPCDQTVLPADTGKTCSAIVEDRGAAIVAKVGETFSEYSSYILIQRTDNGWAVVRTADIPPPDEQSTTEALPF